MRSADNSLTAVRAGIIGLSWIASDPASPASSPQLGTAPPYSHASALSTVDSVEVVAVCDIRAEARASFLETWGNRWSEVGAFDNVDEMLRATELDLVSIVTPDHLHGTMIDKCLDADIPMIFTEKPFTTSLTEADRLLARIGDTGATVAVNHTWRWRPEIAEARAQVTAGSLGPLSQITIEAGGPRAMLFRNLSHFLDLALHVAGAEAKWVLAELEPGHEDYGLEYGGDGGTDPSLDPGAWAMIGFPGGVRAYVSGWKASTADVSIQIQCRDGRISIDSLGARIVENPRTSDGTPASISGPVSRPLRPRHTVSGMQAGLLDLLDARAKGGQPSSSAASARSTVAVIDAILRSNHTGERVEVS